MLNFAHFFPLIGLVTILVISPIFGQALRIDHTNQERFRASFGFGPTYNSFRSGLLTPEKQDLAESIGFSVNSQLSRVFGRKSNYSVISGIDIGFKPILDVFVLTEFSRPVLPSLYVYVDVFEDRPRLDLMHRRISRLPDFWEATLTFGLSKKIISGKRSKACLGVVPYYSYLFRAADEYDPKNLAEGVGTIISVIDSLNGITSALVKFNRNQFGISLSGTFQYHFSEKIVGYCSLSYRRQLNSALENGEFGFVEFGKFTPQWRSTQLSIGIFLPN